MSEIKLTKETIDLITEGIKNVLQKSIHAEKEYLKLEIPNDQIETLEGLSMTALKLVKIYPSVQFYIDTHWQTEFVLSHYIILKFQHLIHKDSLTSVDNNLQKEDSSDDYFPTFDETRENIKDCLEFFQTLSEKL